jgi:hypothetical protein
VSIGENGGAVRRDEFIDNTAKDIMERIPPPYDVARTRQVYELKLTPTIIVLLQELQRFNLLLQTMRKTLELLRKASNVRHVQQQLCHSKVKVKLFLSTPRRHI